MNPELDPDDLNKIGHYSILHPRQSAHRAGRAWFQVASRSMLTESETSFELVTSPNREMAPKTLKFEHGVSVLLLRYLGVVFHFL